MGFLSAHTDTHVQTHKLWFWLTGQFLPPPTIDSVVKYIALCLILFHSMGQHEHTTHTHTHTDVDPERNVKRTRTEPRCTVCRCKQVFNRWVRDNTCCEQESRRHISSQATDMHSHTLPHTEWVPVKMDGGLRRWKFMWLTRLIRRTEI